MADHGYESGRLNLPFVGLCTFGKQPTCLDWDAIDADVAVMGIPFDMGTQYRSGARFGPRAIREASTLFSFGHSGAYDHEDGMVYLPKDEVRIVDIGDADMIHTDTIKSLENAEYGVRKILAATMRSIFPASEPSTIKSRCILSISTPIWILSMSATACATVMATRSGGHRK